MPLVYRQAGFTQYLSATGNVMYRSPKGVKVSPGGQRCRRLLSQILQKRPDLNHISDSVKTASPPRKPAVLQNRLRPRPDERPTPKKEPDLESSPSFPAATPSIKKEDAPKPSPHSYGFFRKLHSQDQFIALCGSKQVTQFFAGLAEHTSCSRVVDGHVCGGKYLVSEFVDSGTGGEMTFSLKCNGCQHQRFFGDGCSTASRRQSTQCGVPPGDPVSSDTGEEDDDARIEASIGKTMLYNFLLASRGKYEQYKKLFGRTGDAYSQKTFDRAVTKCMKIVMEVLDEEVKAMEAHLRETGQWSTAYIGTDGSWCTPGASAPHGLFCARALQAWGGLLGYHFMSRNDPETPYLLTSASMEVIGCIIVSQCQHDSARTTTHRHMHIHPGVERFVQTQSWGNPFEHRGRWRYKCGQSVHKVVV